MEEDENCVGFECEGKFVSNGIVMVFCSCFFWGFFWSLVVVVINGELLFGDLFEGIFWCGEGFFDFFLVGVFVIFCMLVFFLMFWICFCFCVNIWEVFCILCKWIDLFFLSCCSLRFSFVWWMLFCFKVEFLFVEDVIFEKDC